MKAYFDDAKTFGKSNMVLLAGYVADDREWDALTREWNILLDKHGIQRLHTADFLAAKSREYAAFADDKCPYQKRVEIVRDFFIPVRKHILCGLTVALDVEAYRPLFEGWKKRLSPEMFCFSRLMKLTMDHIRMWADPFPLTLIFDDSEHSMRFHALYKARKGNDPAFNKGVSGITFADDKLVPAVQAADMLACVMSKEAHQPIEIWMHNSPFDDILNATDPAYGKLYMAESWDKARLEKVTPQLLAATWNGDLPPS